jgi:pyruvate phosphate dikinase-like enzyme
VPRSRLGVITPTPIPRFARRFFDAATPVTTIGGGAPGGKARGLIRIRDVLAAHARDDRFANVHIRVPAMVVLQTGVFDRFMDHNRLWPVVESNPEDVAVALAFQKADLPVDIVGDLRAIVEQVRVPLAVRSSSLLEDAVEHPSAGVYTTKMIPNDQHGADARFRRLTGAIKLVYASTFFARGRRSIEAAGGALTDERMAVIIQEIVGRRHEGRFYPDVSGVARSLGFYRTGTARPEDGIASLALGLGKTIVDGGVAWTYSPAYPQRPGPFASTGDLLRQTQTEFWAVSMAGRPRYDPVSEVEYLDTCTLADAEADGTLRHAASTYDASSDRLRIGIAGPGPRALTFAPLLVTQEYPINDVIRALLDLGGSAENGPVEIEFAFTFDSAADPPCRCGFLQVRPMSVSSDVVEIDDETMHAPGRIVASENALGNGTRTDVSDIVFVRRDRFDAAESRVIARDVGDLNRDLAAQGRPYVLIGFGRWGSSDPWLGIPTDWAAISGAAAIVETALEGLNAEPSQASHFFHNVSNAGVAYFSVRPGIDPPIDWAWLESLPVVRETDHVRHARTASPFDIRVDGRSGRGVVLRGAAS